MAGSYFSLSTSLDPIFYRLTVPRNEPGFVKLGTDLQAKTGVVNLTLNYGVTTRIEANRNLPIVTVGAQASEVYAGKGRIIAIEPTPGGLNAAIKHGALSLQSIPYADIPGVSFNEGMHAGVGRISLGTKALLYVGRGPFLLATKLRPLRPESERGAILWLRQRGDPPAGNRLRSPQELDAAPYGCRL